MHRFHRHSRPRSSTTLTATAQAVVALVAIATVSTMIGSPALRAGSIGGAGSDPPHRATFAVAAAVAAVAREIAGGGDRIQSAVPAELVVLSAIAQESDSAAPSASALTIPSSTILAEQLIDLPPPAC